ncbi:hypothetical protein ACFLQL_01455 [Verrucomicrobiota bacterium]
MINVYKFIVLIHICMLMLSGLAGKASAATNVDSNISTSSAVDEKSPEGENLLRDPFWPIGYAPAGVSRPTKSGGPESGGGGALTADVSKILKIGGVIMKGGKFYATINGFTVQAGEVITALSGGKVYRFLVEKIDLKNVKVKLLK